MSDTATELESVSLAVKYRPQIIDDLVGNQALKEVVNGFFEGKMRVPSTLLLTGPFGMGKTTTARILSRMILCKTHTACGQCAACKMGLENSPAYKEVNVGAEGGVDSARAMIAESKYASPVGGKRIYVLDEAHKLTGAAASALLTTLEEPGKNTIWMLCTNLPEKLLDTVRSRCAILKVSPPKVGEIAGFLWRTAKSEGAKLKEDQKPLFKTMATLGGGHVRDSMSILELYLSATRNGTKKVPIETIMESFVATDEQNLDNLAVEVLIAVGSGQSKRLVANLVQAGTQARGILYKLRFMIDLKISKWAGVSKFYTANLKLFDEKVPKANEPQMILMLNHLQETLIELESRFNTVPGLDERVGLQTVLMTHTARWAAKAGAAK